MVQRTEVVGPATVALIGIVVVAVGVVDGCVAVGAILKTVAEASLAGDALAQAALLLTVVGVVVVVGALLVLARGDLTDRRASRLWGIVRYSLLDRHVGLIGKIGDV